jgi:peptidoglycan/LPS O-acetylase OafA/YrhL
MTAGSGTELRHEQYLASSHRPAFDGMRGIGFLLVITAHIPSAPLFGYLQGWSAVWLFFVISGYLLTMLMMREEQANGRIRFGPFLIKRFFRIVPAYLAAVLIYWLACLMLAPLADEIEPFKARLPYYLTFMPEYAQTKVFTIFVHSWTVGIELKFYLLFPPLVFLLIKDATWRLAVTAITAVLLTTIGTFTAHSYVAILCGAMLAMAMERPRGYALIARLTRVPAVVPLTLLAALFALLARVEIYPPVAAVATYLVAYAIVQQGAWLPVLLWRPLVYLGQRSYGAYLLHMLMIRFGYMAFGNDTALGGYLTASLCLALTIPAAELLYRTVEQPGAALARRLTARP